MIISFAAAMHVLLLNPPNPPGLQANRDFMGNFGMLNTRPGVVLPPLHLVQMAGTVPPDRVRFLDAAAEDLSPEETRGRVRTLRAGVAIVLTSTPTCGDDYALARWIKLETRAAVYLYGPHPAHTPAEAFSKSGADGILVGYTPRTLDRLLEGSPRDLPELVLPGAAASPPPIAPDFDMDELPFGAWGLTPLSRYRFDLREPTPFATMRTSLGCLYDCAFCPYVLAEGRRFLAMSAERIHAEMEHLARDFGARFLLFRDILFTARRERIERLCDLLTTKPLPLAWRAETSPQHLSTELLRRMKKAGCNGLNLGVEAADGPSAEEMDLIPKRRSLDHAREIFRACREIGIKANAMFVLGFPEDSREGILRTIGLAKSLDAETVQFAFAMPFPGTRLADISRRENLVEERDWAAYSSLRSVLRTRHLARPELDALVRHALRAVYLRPKKLARMLFHPCQSLRRAHAFASFYLHRGAP